MKLSREQIKNLLSTKILAKFLKEKSLHNLNHEITMNPRLRFKNEHHYGTFIGMQSSQEMSWFQRDSFLTGGALCALILEKFTQVPAVINDVDIFYYQFNKKTVHEADREMYENLVDESFHYKIEEVSESGLLNLIKITPAEEFSWLKLLKSFDLNYAQVGLILEENRLIFTEEFIDFLMTQEIQFAPDFEDEFPLTSYLRGVHKSKDLQSKFYIQDELKNFFFWNHPTLFLGETLIPITTNRKEAEESGQELVTEKRLTYWKNHPQVLAPWVNLKESQLEVSLPKEPWVEFMNFLASDLKKSNDGTLSFKGSIFHKFQAIPKLLNQKRNFYKRIIPVIESNLVNDWSKILPNNYAGFYKDFSQKELELTKKFCFEHSRIKELFELCLQLNWEMGHVLDLFQKIRGLSLPEVGFLESSLGYYKENTRPTFFMGLNSKNQNLILSFSKLLEEKNSKEIINFIKNEYDKIKIDQQLTTPLHHPFKGYVKEIFLLNDLINEGNRMHHCCGGYANEIKNQRCRIFHLKIGNSHSTLEVNWKTMPLVPIKSSLKKKTSPSQRINFNKKTEYFIKQNKSYANQVPSKSLQILSKMLIKYLNNYQN